MMKEPRAFGAVCPELGEEENQDPPRTPALPLGTAELGSSRIGDPVGGDVAPWWIAIATGIVAALAGAIGKLWSENRALRRELDDARQANIEDQQTSFREHRRDLRSLIGLPTSLDPGPLGVQPIDLATRARLDPLRPPILIRAAAPKRRASAKRASE